MSCKLKLPNPDDTSVGSDTTDQLLIRHSASNTGEKMGTWLDSPSVTYGIQECTIFHWIWYTYETS